MKITTVIFDLDGTITKPFLDFDAIRTEMGLSVKDGPILEAMEKMSPQQRNHAEEILTKHEQQAVDESSLNDGAEQTLNSLRQARIHIGILTRNKRTNAEAIAKKHNLRFDAIVAREDGPVKPDPFGVLQLCRQFGTSAEQTLVVGDYLYDILSAKAAGAIAVLLANHSKAEDFSKHADYTITTLNEIPKIIENHPKK